MLDCPLIPDARVRQLRSADTRTLVVSRTHSSLGDRTFATVGPQIWNSLLPNLRLCGLSYGQFRRSHVAVGPQIWNSLLPNLDCVDCDTASSGGY